MEEKPVIKRDPRWPRGKRKRPGEEVPRWPRGKRKRPRERKRSSLAAR